jgi:hypothetical protein
MDKGQIIEALRNGASINGVADDGCTALMMSATPNRYGDHWTGKIVYEIIELLLRQGADPSLQDALGLRAADYVKRYIDGCSKDIYGDTISKEYTDAGDREYILKAISILS